MCSLCSELCTKVPSQWLQAFFTFSVSSLFCFILLEFFYFYPKISIYTPDLEIILGCLGTRPNVKIYSATERNIYTLYWSDKENFAEIISKSAENIGESAEYTVNSAEISKNICRNLNLYSKILNNGPYKENSLKIFCRLKYILGTRIPGYTTISRSAPDTPHF